MNRRVIASWCLYDFANSFFAALPAVVWQTYYQQKIVGNEAGQGDFWWGNTLSTAMLLVALSSPMMGGIADYAGVRKRLLVLYTAVCVGATVLYTTVEPGMVLWGFVVSVISIAAFEGALVFYNAYLPEIAPPEYQGRVSGWGFAAGYVGSLLGLVLALPFAQAGNINLAFLCIAAAFLVFSLPAFFVLPADAKARRGVVDAALGGLREARSTFEEILRLKETRRFLLAYFFFEDGVITVINVSAGFAAKSLGFTTQELLIMFAVVQASALAGAWAWAVPTDRLGPKRVVMTMLVQWTVVIVCVLFVQTKMQFFLVAVLAGTGLGAIQAASRAFMSTLIPAGREAEFFGFYSLCGKSASIVGPLIYGVSSVLTGGNQRRAILSVLALFMIGALLLRRVEAGGPTGKAEVRN